MIGEPTQALMRDVFGKPDLFAGLPKIERRIVRWGSENESMTLPHTAVVVSESMLAKRAGASVTKGIIDEQARWMIHAGRQLPEECRMHRFGSRTAAARAVRMRPGSDGKACWIESLDEGWLFLIPSGEGAAWLLAVGSEPGALLAESRIVGAEIDSVGEAGGDFAAYPRIADPLCGAAGWLACGSAAMGFDPLCGDGSGNAVREGILAAAVVRAALEGGAVDDLMLHYETRLLSGFHRHLQQCYPFYAKGHTGEWWRGELEQLVEGMKWCRAQLDSLLKAMPGGARYALRDFVLERI
jgi:flavin-dependent dehydrogenase